VQDPGLTEDRVLGMSRTRLAGLLASPVAWIAVSATAVAVVYTAYVWLIPVAAAQVADSVPVAWEAQLGRAVTAQLVGSRRVSRGRVANRAVERITDRLLSAHPANPYNITVTIINDPTENAFAAPGGRIVVFTGLMRRMETPEQLAGVLAHELQHVLHRHGTRSIFQQSAVAVLASVLGGDSGSSMTAAMDGVSTMGALAYSRRYEREADAAAVEMLRRARVDVRGMVEFFQSVGASEEAELGALSYFSTHPATSSRIASIEAIARDHDYVARPLMTPEEWTAAVHDARRYRAARGDR
jgi:beta-barrel assembly-enhancing protease